MADCSLSPSQQSESTMQPALVLSSGNSVSDGDGGGEDVLSDGSAEVHRHCLWKIELLQLPQEVHPLLGFLGEGANIQFPIRVLGNDCDQEAEGVYSVDWGVTQGNGVGWGCVLPVIHNHLYCL